MVELRRISFNVIFMAIVSAKMRKIECLMIASLAGHFVSSTAARPRAIKL